MEKIALALGSNQGDCLAALRAAVERLAAYMQVTAVSPVYETAAAYIANQPSFLNAALVGETRLAPLALLWNLKKLETELGRLPTFHYGPRLIDIDILFYGDQVVATPELTVPHPRMAEREFVLCPLADIAPDWVHPQTGMTVSEMLERVASTAPKNLGPLL
ncbi:MAG: 2-amino-4-hydroxy-6-hydroxymethyldihydropteridine diphosphokinase [Alphaproteobacteria bacterium]|nr:2-amino-4-hydroxy-6-hydroxymethyldihydropteridine diphosphokinase [Alphaproteobacteria bacterium]